MCGTGKKNTILQGQFDKERKISFISVFITFYIVNC